MKIKAKKILVANTEYNEGDPDDREQIPMSELAASNEFEIIASTEQP